MKSIKQLTVLAIKTAGITKYALAKKLGLQPQAVQQILKGEKQTRLEQIAVEVGVIPSNDLEFLYLCCWHGNVEGIKYFCKRCIDAGVEIIETDNCSFGSNQIVAKTARGHVLKVNIN